MTTTRRMFLTAIVGTISVILLPTSAAPLLGNDSKLLVDVSKSSAPSTPTSKIHVIRLEHANVSALASILERVTDQQSAKLAADVRTNSLVLSVPDAQLEQLLEVIADLDVPQRVRTEEVKSPIYPIRVFPLQTADAQELLDTLRTVIASDVILLSADIQSNSLVISAPPQELAVVVEVVKKLDAERVKRFAFKLEHIPVTDKIKIGEAFRLTYSGHDYPALYAAWGDPETNSIIITAPPEAGRAIRETIAQWDGQYLGFYDSSDDSRSDEIQPVRSAKPR